MFKSLKKIIQNIQTAEESKKKRWLIILSAIAMILVIGSWVAYLNKTIVNLNPAGSTQENNQSPVQISKESPWQTFLTGLKTVTGQINELIVMTRKITIEANNPDSATSSDGIIPQQ